MNTAIKKQIIKKKKSSSLAATKLFGKIMDSLGDGIES